MARPAPRRALVCGYDASQKEKPHERGFSDGRCGKVPRRGSVAVWRSAARAELAPWVGFFEKLFRDKLLDDDEPLGLQNRPFDGSVLVPGRDREVGWFVAHGLILLRGQLDVFNAGAVGALTDELDVASGILVGRGKACVRFPDPLIDLSKESLVRR